MSLRPKAFTLSEFLLFVVLLTYLVLRACLVPVTHDEPATALYYAQMPVWDIVRYTDPIPNNHILHTLLLKATEAVFGTSQFSIRIPNLLGFVLYFWSAVAISRSLDNRWLRASLLLLLLLNPYLDDFFSLARGYALSLDFLLLACAFFLKWQQTTRLWYLQGALMAGILSVYSNFSTLYFYLPFVFLLVVLAVQQRKKYALWPSLFSAVGALALLSLLCLVPIQKMTATNQLQYWNSTGFYREILNSLSYMTMYGRMGANAVLLLNITVIALFAGMGWYLLRRCLKNRRLPLDRPFPFFFLLLGGSAAIAILAQVLADVPYLSSRTALLYYPLFVLALVFFFAEIALKGARIAIIAGSFLALALSWHFLRSVNLYAAREWWFDADNRKVLRYLREEHERSGAAAPFSFGCSWWFHPSLSFYIKTGEAGKILAEPLYSKEPDLGGRPLYYYAVREEKDRISPEYEPVLVLAEGGRILFRRRLPALK